MNEIAPQFEMFGPDLILLEELASGGMAQVFRARMLGTGGFEKTVAVKRILPHFASRPEFKAMFQREMNLCAKMQHPNVVQVFKNGAYQGYLYLVMEFVDGKNIVDLIQLALSKKIRIPVEICCHIIAYVAKGLAYAHSLKDEETGDLLQVIHRDVSPQNIMLSYNGEVKVVDFGIAKAAQSVQLTKTGDLKGKIAYLSPEYIEGKKIDSRSDIFAIGVVFYELLTQRMLFGAENTFEAMRKICEAEIPRPSLENPLVPEELEFILTKMLERNPDNRTQSAAEISTNLSLFLNHHYPRFTSNDFSTFLQTLFADEIGKEQEKRRIVNDSVRASNLQDNPGIGEATQVRSIGQNAQRDSAQRHVSAQSEPTTDQLNEDELEINPWTRPLRLAILSALIGLNVVLGVGLYRMTQQQAALDANLLTGVIGHFQPTTLDLPVEGKVSLWPQMLKDSSPAVQPLPLHQPRFQIKTSIPLITFDGFDDFLTDDPVAFRLKQFQALTVIAVARTSKVKRQVLWSLHHSDRDTDLARLAFTPHSEVRLKANPTVGTGYLDSAPMDTIDFAVYTTIIENSSAVVYRNGKQIIQSTLNEAPAWQQAGAFTIGAEYDAGSPGDFFSGDLAEILLFGIPVSNAHRLAIEEWLYARYKIMRD